MVFLLGTSIVSELMREHPGVTASLMRLSSTDRVVVCPVVHGEIRYGIERLAPGSRRRDLEVKAARLFDAVPCVPIAEAAANHYASLKTATRTHGLSLDENDLWIAATARTLGATLVSRDRDFSRLGGLTTVDWTQ